MSKPDYLLVAPLLLPFFPSMEKATSEEWFYFLNDVTGLSLPYGTPVAAAADRWREALQRNAGLSVWDETAEKRKKVEARIAELKAAEAKRLKDEPDLLARLRLEAPGQPVKR